MALGLSTKVFFFTEHIHANGGVNSVRASVKIQKLPSHASKVQSENR